MDFGAILSYMHKGMNRSFFSDTGGFGATEQSSSNQTKNKDLLKVEMQMMAFLMKCIIGNYSSWLWYGCCTSSTCFKRNGRY